MDKVNHIKNCKKTRDTTLYNPVNYISIELNNRGDFMELIHDLGINNEYFKEFYGDIQMTGGLSPSIVARFLYNNKEFDFNNIDNRLWAVVFFTDP